MKVVFVGNFALWRKGTMGSRTLPMARELQAAGHNAVLVVPPWDAPEEGDSATRAWSVPVRNVPVRTGLARHPSIVFELLRATLAERPDVLVAVKPKAYAGLLALLLPGVRIVVDADDWEGGWSALAGDAWPVRALVDWQERAALLRADHVVVASRALDGFVRSVGAKHVSYVPNASWPGAAGWPTGDGSRARAALGLGDDPVVLLYSRLFEFRLERLLRVLDAIRRSVPSFRLLVVGTGLRGDERGLRAGLAARGHLERTALVGWAKREDVSDLLAVGDVALVPMDDTDVNRARCSVKLLDLMLAGRALVADAVGQAREYVRDDHTGCLVDPADPTTMADAAVRLLRRPSTARRLGRAAARVARRDLTWSAQREKLLAAIIG